MVAIALAIGFSAPIVSLVHHAAALDPNQNVAPYVPDPAGVQKAQWINAGTIRYEGIDFVDNNPTDGTYSFIYDDPRSQNPLCRSRIQFDGFPYGAPGNNDQQANFQLSFLQSNGGVCSFVDGGTVGNNNGSITVPGSLNRLVTFFVDDDGNIKSINPTTAISFVKQPNTASVNNQDQNVYIRSPGSECANVIVQLQGPPGTISTAPGGSKWALYSMKTGGNTGWAVYFQIVGQGSGTPVPTTGPGAWKCQVDVAAYTNPYLAQSHVKPDGYSTQGYYLVTVGDTSNAGQSKGAVNGPTAGASDQSSPGSDLSQMAPTCESSGYNLSWILCPVFNATTGLVGWFLANLIQPLLQIDTDFVSDSSPIYRAWSAFRIYGNIFLAGLAIFVVLGRAIGTASFEATTRTFVLRFLVVVAIGSAGIYILAGIYSGFNIITNELGVAITAPLKGEGSYTFSPDGMGINIIGGVSAAGIGAALAAGMGKVLWGPAAGDTAIVIGLFVVLPIALSMIALMAVMILRRIFLIFLAMTSTVWIYAFALKQTENIGHKAINGIMRAGIIGGMVTGAFALCDVGSYLLLSGTNNHSVFNAVFATPAEMVGGYFMILLPLGTGWVVVQASGWAGSQIGQRLRAGANSIHQGILGDRQNPHSVRNKSLGRFRAGVRQGQADVMAQGDSTSASRWQKARGRLVGQSWLFGDVTQAQSDYNAASGKARSAKTDTGNDSEIFAGAGWTGTDATTGERVYYNSKGEQISRNLYDRGKRLHGRNSHEIGESLMYTLGKVQNEPDMQAWRTAFGKNALAQGWSDSEMVGAYAHAAYPHKRNQATAWYSMPEYERNTAGQITGVKFNDVGDEAEARDKTTGAIMTDSAGNVIYDHKTYDNMIEDLHKSRGSFDLSGDRHQEFQVMLEHQKRLQGRVRAGTASQNDRDALAKTYETFEAVSSRMQTGADPDGNVTATGVSAASKAVIEAAVNDRTLDMTSVDTTTGNREFFDREQMVNATKLSKKPYSPSSSVKSGALPGGISTYGEANTYGAIAKPGATNVYTGASGKTPGDIGRSGLDRVVTRT